MENTDNRFTKSYTNLTCDALPLGTRNLHDDHLNSFGAFGYPSKERLFVMDGFKWTPPGFATWILDKDKSPGMVNLRQNRIYAHEVAAKLVEEKRQELKGGTSRRDVMSLLGSPYSAL